MGKGERCYDITKYEPRQDKTNKMSVRPAKTQISDQSLHCPHEESFGP